MGMNVNLTPHLEDLVRQKVESGLYSSASEVVREALRMMDEQDRLRAAKLSQLRGDIEDGLKSGGFIRKLAEAGTKGACLIREHEQRSVDFMRSYLASGPLAEYAPLAELIHTTNFARCACETLAGLGPQLVDLGRMLGTSDLISQISGRFYLERCHHFLFQEFVDAGADRTVSPTGETVILYATPEDLLRKTPGFYEHLVKPRLENEFQSAHAYIGDHFGGDDPYQRAMQRNLDFLREMIASNDFSRMRRKPVPLMPEAGT